MITQRFKYEIENKIIGFEIKKECSVSKLFYKKMLLYDY